MLCNGKAIGFVLASGNVWVELNSLSSPNPQCVMSTRQELFVGNLFNFKSYHAIAGAIQEKAEYHRNSHDVRFQFM